MVVIDDDDQAAIFLVYHSITMSICHATNQDQRRAAPSVTFCFICMHFEVSSAGEIQHLKGTLPSRWRVANGVPHARAEPRSRRSSLGD
jgi:hypothetical protein